MKTIQFKDTKDKYMACLPSKNFGLAKINVTNKDLNFKEIKSYKKQDDYITFFYKKNKLLKYLVISLDNVLNINEVVLNIEENKSNTDES